MATSPTDETINQLKTLISDQPGKKAKILADRLGIDKKKVNQLLHQHAGLFRKDAGFGWHLNQSGVVTNAEPTPARPPFTAKPQLSGVGPMPRPDFDQDQVAVIEAPPRDRLLVTAKPGTGKTAIASARVAGFLADALVSSGGILVVSFTRTAVFEIKTRIDRELAHRELEISIGADVRTIDSLAWHITQLADRTTTGGHEASIAMARSCIEDEVIEVTEWLGTLEHLIVDEAQDIVGERHRFIQTLIGALPDQAGVTVLGDPHQAIYQWQADEAASPGAKENMAGLFPVEAPPRLVELRNSYRFDDDQLADLLDDVRDVLAEKNDATQRARIDGILEDSELEIKWGGDLTQLPEIIRDRDDVLVLVRGRAQAAALIDRFMGQKSPHRIRMPNQPDWIEPWIGRIFGGWTEIGSAVKKDEFQTRYSKVIGPDENMDERWDRLTTHTRGRRRGTLNIDHLRTVLARPGRPPVDLCLNDYGTRGPIIGTIHASKGREAPNVLVIPSQSSDKDNAEEDRVYYVALSRAKGRVRVSTGSQMILQGGTTRSSSGRPTKRLWSPSEGNAYANLWVGEDGDLDPTWAVHNISDAEAIAHQEALWTKRQSFDFVASARPDQGDEDKRRILSLKDGGYCIGRLGSQVHFAAVRASQHYWPGENYYPTWYQFLYMVGTTTYALDMESQVTLPSNLDNTKIFLAPVIRGWCKVHFKKGRP